MPENREDAALIMKMVVVPLLWVFVDPCWRAQRKRAKIFGI
jgi:hypothetical protein